MRREDLHWIVRWRTAAGLFTQPVETLDAAVAYMREQLAASDVLKTYLNGPFTAEELVDAQQKAERRKAIAKSVHWRNT